LAFVDCKKASDRVDRSKLLEMLTDDGTPNQISTAIYNLYRNNVIAIQLKSKESETANQLTVESDKDVLYHHYFSTSVLMLL
jgi:hypothetical protein